MKTTRALRHGLAFFSALEVRKINDIAFTLPVMSVM